jgi:predicted metal-dependent hydrolase
MPRAIPEGLNQPHELFHLKIHNHGPAFYRLLTRCMPDWRQRKERLEEFAV